MKKAIYIIVIVSIYNTIYTYYKQKQTEKRLQTLEDLITLKNSVKVTATMYNPVKGQCDSDPLITAGMFKINPHRASEHKWIAVSRDLLKKNGGTLEYGDKVKLMGTDKKDGVYIVVDTMNKRYKKRIDILETKGTPLYKYENVMLAKL